MRYEQIHSDLDNHINGGSGVKLRGTGCKFQSISQSINQLVNQSIKQSICQEFWHVKLNG